MKKILSLLLIVLVSALLLVSCDMSMITGGGNGGDETLTEYRVTLVPTSGASVTTENPINVVKGGNAEFVLSLDSEAVFRSAKVGDTEVGYFDYKTGKFTVGNVTSDMRINFTVEDVGYDTTVGYKYHFYATNSDKSSKGNAIYQAGTEITVTAGMDTRNFAGWSIGGRIDEGGTLLSAERTYTFDLTQDTILYANYVDSNMMYYNLNGGTVNTDSKNMSATAYYTATLADGLVSVALKQSYLDEIGCASTFWDDGSFTREGYVLKEYNTAADGSGEGYSLGSKFPMNLGSAVLYCIWAKDSSIADFEYSDYTFSRPAGVLKANSPEWQESGVIITKYKGNDREVTIPESIGDKPVIAIAAGAFENKDMETLVMSRYLLKVEDGAFRGCDALETIYYPDGIYSIGNDALDSASYTSLHNFYVNATIAPRCSNGDAAFAKKFTRLLANSDKNRIIVIAGSSSYQGLSSAYMEALLGGEYCVVNFGTTRTTHGYMYLEAMQYYAHEGDVILYAPENSIYMMGEPRLYWKTLRDLEGMYNIFRHIDIANYENVLGAFCEFNAGSAEDAADPNYAVRYERSPRTYEEIINATHINEYGEYQYSKREGYFNANNYKDAYIITLNNRFKSRLEGAWNNVENQQANADYTDPDNITWCSVDDARYKDQMNRVIALAKSSGAKVYFSFCPVDASSLCTEALADHEAWFAAYDKLIKDTYVFDGIIGTSGNYVMDRNYFYDCAFHPNDYGRTYRTYTLYLDLCDVLGVGVVKGIHDVGHDFEGCLFEEGSVGVPRYPAFY